MRDASVSRLTDFVCSPDVVEGVRVRFIADGDEHALVRVAPTLGAAEARESKLRAVDQLELDPESPDRGGDPARPLEDLVGCRRHKFLNCSCYRLVGFLCHDIEQNRVSQVLDCSNQRR